jgi:CBS domain-containing protein
MAVRVAEIMNREVFQLRPDESMENALGYILALGISGAPVIDAEGRAQGMLSLRDAIPATAERKVAEGMSRPVATVPASSTIADAGRLMAETGHHRLVVVDESGRTVGNLSALDVVRGLLGMPTRHPAAFPHLDEKTRTTWTDEEPLDARRAEAAPDGAGIFVLVEGRVGLPDQAVWVEAAGNLRRRLYELVTAPQSGNPALARVLERPQLRFRLAGAESFAAAQRLADDMLRRAHGMGIPAGSTAR